MFAISLSFGLLCSGLTSSFGIKGAVLPPAVLLAAFVIPTVRKESLARLGSLRKQMSWWHGLWLLVFISALVFRMRDTRDISASAIDFWALYRVALMGVVGFALTIRLAMKKPSFSLSLFRGLLGGMLSYSLFCLFSTTWSAYRAWTLYKSVEYLIVVVLIAAIVATFRFTTDYKQVFDLTWAIDGLLLLCIWIGALLWPSQAFEPSGGAISVQLQGVVPVLADNGVGHVSAILSVVALSRFLRKPQSRGSRVFYLAFLGLTLLTLLLAQTRSAILGFVFGAALLLYFSRRTGWIVCLLLLTGLLFFHTGAGSLFTQYMRRGQNADEVASLSGRTDWWESGWTELQRRPWTGMGGFTARFTVLAKYGDQEVSTVHNTYLEAALGVGLIGLVAILITFIGVWKWVIWGFRYPATNPIRRQLALEAVAVLGVITVRSFFSVGLIVHYDIDFMAVLGFAELGRRLPERIIVPANRHRPAVWPCAMSLPDRSNHHAT